MTISERELATWQILSEPAPEIDEDGTKRWFNKDGLVHRDNDLPAVICQNGSMFWQINGKLHRDGDLPAVILGSGTKWWFKHNQRHRDNDMPAVIRGGGEKEWWINGVLIRRDY